MTASHTDTSLRGSLKSSLIVAFVSGLAGLVVLAQDVIIASRFGTSAAADAYQLAISFPILAINVLAGGTLLAVLVPLLVQLDVAGRRIEAVTLIKQTRHMMGWALLTVCALWALAYPYIAGQIARKFSADTLILSTQLLWVVVPGLLFSGLASVEAAVLNSRRRFIFISTLPAFMPAGVILGIWLLEARLGIYAAAFGLLCASTIQWLTGRRLTAPLLPQVEDSPPFLSLTRLLRDYGTAAAAAALLSGILLSDTFMASTLAPGSTSTYSYATRPVMLLLAFATAVVGNVTLPFFSHLVATGDWHALKKYVLLWFSLITIAALPVVSLWYFHVTDIVALLYQRGTFDPADSARVAAVQQIYLLQIPFFLVAVIGWRVMNSLNRHAVLLVITAMCFAVNLAADLWLAPRLGLQGIAWGTNLAFALWALLITFYLLRIRSKNAAMARHDSEPIFPFKSP